MTKSEHITTCLGEEAIEVAHELAKLTSKTNRFGPEEVNILKPDGPNNAQRICDELNDLLGVVQLLVQHRILPPNWQDKSKQEAKQRKVRKFMRYAEELGRIQ